jgi:hypothetical protein
MVINSIIKPPRRQGHQESKKYFIQKLGVLGVLAVKNSLNQLFFEIVDFPTHLFQKLHLSHRVACLSASVW